MDTGLKFDRIAGSRLGFFRQGLTTACLNTFGTDPELRQLLINMRRLGHTVLKTCLSIWDGIMSSGQLVDLIPWTTSSRRDRDSVDRGSNTLNTAEVTAERHTSVTIGTLPIVCLTDYNII